MLKKISLSDLAKIDLTQDAPIHPEWVNAIHHQGHDDHGHAHHELTKEESFTHKGNEVRITTTYKVEVNGQEVMLHANFNERGTLQCHNTPYKGFKTVREFMEALINNTPAAAIPGSEANEERLGHALIRGVGAGQKNESGAGGKMTHKEMGDHEDQSDHADHGDHGDHGNHGNKGDHSNHADHSNH